MVMHLRRAYPVLLLGVLGLILFQSLQTGAPTSAPARSTTQASATAPLPTGGRASLQAFRSWQARFEAAPEARRTDLLPEGRRLAAKRRDSFRRLMRSQPRVALAEAISLSEHASLPTELKDYFEQPISGIGTIDLHWRTDLAEDGSLHCRHEQRLELDGVDRTVVGPDYTSPRPPLRNVPVSGIALGNLAVLSPRPLLPLQGADLEAANALYPAAKENTLDPLTGSPVDPAVAALVGGKVHRFESAESIARLQSELWAACQDAWEAELSVLNHPFEWLAGDTNGDEEAPVEATPFNEDVLDVLFIRVDFPDLPGEPISQVDLESTLASVDTHVQEFSYGEAEINYTVTPAVHRMPTDGAVYAAAGDNTGIKDDARMLASDAGYNLANYDVVAVYFTDLGDLPMSQITYGGLASIGGANHWINGANSTNVILHEFGHNYGLYHANYWDPDQNLSGSYEVPGSREYGDIFDRMGSGSAPEAHFSHFAKNRLQWMPDSKVAEATTDGTFRIYRFDHFDALANPTLAVKVPMGGDIYYWIGYRQLYTSSSYNLATGAYLVAEGLSQNAETNLIDATPGSEPTESDDRRDSGLEIGMPFVESGVTFTALERGGSDGDEWIDVSITFAPRVGLAATEIEVDEQVGTAWVTLQRQFSSSGSVSVDYRTSDVTATAGSDYYATRGTVTWVDGDSSDKRVAIPIRPDSTAEGWEELAFTLENPAGAVLDNNAGTAAVYLLDPGAVYETFDPSFFNNSVNGIVPMDDGRVLIGGTIGASSGDFASVSNIARLHPDGSIDNSFLTGSGFDGRVRALVRQPDGRILAGGEFTSYNGTPCNRVVRLESNGAIDPTFVSNIGSGANDTIRTIALEGDGSILVGGDFTAFNGTGALGLARLNADGMPAPALALPFNTGSGVRIHSVLPEADGKITVGGGFYIEWTGNGFRSGIARLNADGSRDTSFDPDAGAHLAGSTGSLRTVYHVHRLPDGKYLIGGSFTAYDESPASYLARLEPDGSFDATFTPPLFDDRVEAITCQPDGSIMLGGRFSLPVARLALLDPGGPLATGFDTGGGPGGPVYRVTYGPDGTLWVGGNFFSFDGATARPVIKLAGGISPYDRWAAETFTPAQLLAGDGDPGANPDGDEFLNAAERALGTDPLVANDDPIFGPGGNSGGFSLHSSGGQRYLQATVEKTGLSEGAWFVAQFSDNTFAWAPASSQPGGDNPVYEIVEDSPTRFTVRDRTPLDSQNPRRFVKIGIGHPE